MSSYITGHWKRSKYHLYQCKCWYLSKFSNLYIYTHSLCFQYTTWTSTSSSKNNIQHFQHITNNIHLFLKPFYSYLSFYSYSHIIQMFQLSKCSNFLNRFSSHISIKFYVFVYVINIFLIRYYQNKYIIYIIP